MLRRLSHSPLSSPCCLIQKALELLFPSPKHRIFKYLSLPLFGCPISYNPRSSRILASQNTATLTSTWTTLASSLTASLPSPTEHSRSAPIRWVSAGLWEAGECPQQQQHACTTAVDLCSCVMSSHYIPCTLIGREPTPINKSWTHQPWSHMRKVNTGD